MPELEVEDHGRFEGRFSQRPCASSGPTERVRNTVRERMFLIRIARSPNPLRLWARWRDDNEFRRWSMPVQSRTGEKGVDEGR